MTNKPTTAIRLANRIFFDCCSLFRSALLGIFPRLGISFGYLLWPHSETEKQVKEKQSPRRWNGFLLLAIFMVGRWFPPHGGRQHCFHRFDHFPPPVWEAKWRRMQSKKQFKCELYSYQFTGIRNVRSTTSTRRRSNEKKWSFRKRCSGVLLNVILFAPKTNRGIVL